MMKALSTACYLFILLTATSISCGSVSAQTEPRAAAVSFVQKMWQSWSSSNNEGLEFFQESYATSVHYYGGITNKLDVVQLKKEYATRWPQRLYEPLKSSLRSTCAADGDCVVTGLVYWDVRSPVRGKRAVGAANFSIGLRAHGGSFAIIAESGNVLSNDQSALGATAEPYSTAIFPPIGNLFTTSARTKQIAKLVVHCFIEGRGELTVRDMFTCSGVWVTPRALMLCTLGTQCPVLPDTLVGKATVKTTLEAQNLSIDSQLTLQPSSLPALPSEQTIVNCNASSADETDFVRCAVKGPDDPALQAFQTCLASSSASDCLSMALNDEQLKKMSDCLQDRKPRPELVLTCLGSDVAKNNFEAFKACQTDAGSAVEAAICLSTGMNTKVAQIARCIAENQSASGLDCFAGFSPDVDKGKRVWDCVAGQPEDLQSCLNLGMPSKETQIAACLTEGGNGLVAKCLLKDSPELLKAANFYQCASSAQNTAGIMLSCSGELGIDPNVQQTVACVADSGGDRGKLVNCAAQAALPKEAARYVGCVAESQGATSFALCAAGPKMNEEWRIAAECAVQSGGQPYATAACAATRLTIRELTKCFQGNFGETCFGRNNTIRMALDNAFNDLINGPGSNSEIVKALDDINDAVGRVSPEAREFVERPLGGKNAFIPSARDDLLDSVGIGGTVGNAIKNPTQPWKWL
ncbi:hypothetical protein [Rhizobium leguminosarum]|uniref:hypothetical protein n=1 Tax=Rhizobium leguminosarum TaxID=384 RepID=UPI001C9454FF|nr:hypothetical protein [Rhizobium leguminosarum]MBY5645850.1 hypothetical protein [Rhizobium leguminosarum]